MTNTKILLLGRFLCNSSRVTFQTVTRRDVTNEDYRAYITVPHLLYSYILAAAGFK
jgi:hypothetical protein